MILSPEKQRIVRALLREALAEKPQEYWTFKVWSDAKDLLLELDRALETCPECTAYDRVHDERCRLHPDHDGAPKE